MVSINILVFVSHVILTAKLETNDKTGNLMIQLLLFNIILSSASAGAFRAYSKKFSETFYHGGIIPPPP